MRASDDEGVVAEHPHVMSSSLHPFWGQVIYCSHFRGQETEVLNQADGTETTQSLQKCQKQGFWLRKITLRHLQTVSMKKKSREKEE